MTIARSWLILSAIGFGALAAAAHSQTVVQVGTKKFAESNILGELVGHLARRAGAEAKVRTLGGTQALYQALLIGEIDVYPEYTGTITEQILRTQDLPDDAAIRNLTVMVEDEPGRDLLSELGQDPDEPLLGLYLGTPLPERIFGEDPILPDEILIFRGPLERMCQDAEELREQIRVTILHELAHYFGIEDEELEEMGWD